MTTYTWTVDRLFTHDIQGFTQCVYAIGWACTATDSTGQYQYEGHGTVYGLDTPIVSNYIAYSDLTELAAVNWARYALQAQGQWDGVMTALNQGLGLVIADAQQNRVEHTRLPWMPLPPETPVLPPKSTGLDSDLPSATVQPHAPPNWRG
jgi:hypothetical protein